MNDQDESKSPFYSLIVQVVGVIIAVIFMALAVAFLYPVFFGCPHCAPTSSCQANLKQIGNSLKMYLADWDETYPTNRSCLRNGKLGPVSSYVKLSKIGYDKDTDKPYTFQHGVNWVEGLYNYMEPVAERKDTSSVWKCASSNSSAKTDSAEVSYAFNRNLIEQPEKRIQSENTMLMVSEVTGLLDAELRPSNKSNKNPYAVPKQALCNEKIHPEVDFPKGAHVLFADGHVKLYSARALSNGCEWDSTTKSWYCKAAKNSPDYHAIQITP